MAATQNAPSPPEAPALSRRLDIYLVREIAKPFVFFVVVFTGVIWLTQSLRVVDTVINSGQGPSVFVEFSALLLPFVMAIVLPIAIFGATIYAVTRLFGEAELVAMFAAGLSPVALARPIAMFSGVVAAVVFALSVWLAPTAAASLRDRIAEVEADVVGALIFEGRFLHPASGLTIYVRDREGSGEMRGVFVNDARDAAEAVTYTAREASLRDGPDGPQLVMLDGAAQRVEAETGALSLLRFDRLAFDLAQFMATDEDRTRKPQELDIDDLIAPTDEELGGYALGRFYAEGHERLSGPLYALALPLVGVATIVGLGYSRRGYSSRVALAIALGVGLRVGGLATKSLVATTPALWPIMYAPPLLGAIAALWVLSRGGLSASRPPASAAASEGAA